MWPPLMARGHERSDVIGVWHPPRHLAGQGSGHVRAWDGGKLQMAAAMQDVIAARGAGGNWARVHFKKSRPERLMVGYVVGRGGRPCQMGGHFRALRRTKNHTV